VATNRRDALKGALLTAAVGIGTVGTGSIVEGRDSTAKLKTGQKIILHGTGLQLTSQDLKKGELPVAGSRMLARGEIYDQAAGGRKLGEFFATYYRLSTPGKAAHHEPGSLEVHTFVFSDGTLIGSGVANSELDSEGEFAITGGTGRYQGARGSYVARQSHMGMGGNGTATFTLTLI
jgi:hypothetical protein